MQSDPIGRSPAKPPYYWGGNIIVGILLSPLFGFGIGLTIFEITMPRYQVSVTLPSSLGDAVGKAMLREKMREVEMPHVWKIKLCMWLALLLAMFCAVAWVQWSISKRRLELRKSDPSAAEEFDESVALQEPRMWILQVWQYLCELATPNGQQRMVKWLADFFNFKVLLIEILAPFLYIMSLLYITGKGIDLSAKIAVQYKIGGIFGGITYFLIEAILCRLTIEYFMVPFSVQGILRDIHDRITS